MKKILTLAAVSILSLMSRQSSAQMIGDCNFLKGRSIEIGIAPNGAYGSTIAAPAGYHPGAGNTLYDPGSGVTSFGGQLGFVADPAGDGWTVGTPPKYGDFFVPGSPQEGWSIQVNGVQSNAWLTNLSFTGTGYTGTLSGTTTGYTTSGSTPVIKGIWQGQTSDPLSITQTTILDTTKLYFIVNVKIKNTGTSVANNVYYLRTLDPDNEQEQSGDFTTENHIEYQLPNPDNKVMVTAKGTTYPDAFIGLGTKDCRAKCFIIRFSLTPFDNLSTLYDESSVGNYYYTLGTTDINDEGIGLVYNLGNILPGDSTELSYAYVMRASDLDSALASTAPAPVVGSTLLLPGSDTINGCSLTTDTVSVTINNGSGYTWVWSPATGLSSTTGTSTVVDLTAVPVITTYTVIGTPLSASLCSNDTFHFTVMPGASTGPGVSPVYYCQGATSAPLTAIGSNLRWYTTPTGGTGSLTAPTPSTTVPGVYVWWVSQQVGSCTESVRVPITVYVTNTPIVVASNNSPICQNSTLVLTSTDTVTTGVISYSWSGPGGYTSTANDPTIPMVGIAASGIYTLTLTHNGCTATDTTLVVINPAPVISGITFTMPSECNVSDGTMTLLGLSPSTAYSGYYTFNSTTSTGFFGTTDATGALTITGLHAGLYTNIYVLGANGCPSNLMTLSLPDGAAPPAPILSSNGPICADSTLRLFADADTLTGITFSWSGPAGFTSTLQNPVITTASTVNSGTYLCTITKIATGCTSVAGTVNVLVKPTPTASITGNSPVCEGFTLTMTASSTPTGATFSWSGPGGFTGASSTTVIDPAPLTSAGVYTVVATLNGCPSMPATYNAVINPIPAAPTVSPIEYCQYDVATALTAIGSNIRWYTVATGGTGSATAPVPATNAPGNTTYYATQSVLGCESPRAPLVVTVKLKPVVFATPLRNSICHHDTLSIRATGGSYVGATYSWVYPMGASLVSGNDSASGPLVIRFDTSGIRVVSVTATLNGCSTTNFTTIYVVPTPTLDLYATPVVCMGDTALVGLTSTTYFPAIGSYSWGFDGGTVVSATSGTGGPYRVKWNTPGAKVISVTGYTLQSACPSVTMYDTIQVRKNPVATFTLASESCAGDSLLFNADSVNAANSYLWTPEPYFVGLTGGPEAVGIMLSSNTIHLTVTDPYGCTGEDSLYVEVAPCCMMTFADAFTPNNDGVNDYFRPITDGNHQMNTFRIVNRWGNTVYETTTTSSRGWDGTTAGVPQDMGTYFWYCRYQCAGNTIEKTGNVVLVR